MTFHGLKSLILKLSPAPHNQRRAWDRHMRAWWCTEQLHLRRRPSINSRKKNNVAFVEWCAMDASKVPLIHIFFIRGLIWANYRGSKKWAYMGEIQMMALATIYDGGPSSCIGYIYRCLVQTWSNKEYTDTGSCHIDSERSRQKFSLCQRCPTIASWMS